MRLLKKLYFKLSCLYKKFFKKYEGENKEDIHKKEDLGKGGISVISCRVNSIKKRNIQK